VSSEPLVSVVIPAYNQSQFLGEAIESALSQTLERVEVIVVDDGSTDDTQRVAGSFAGRVTYIRQSNQGLAGARNTGITAARGGLIQLLDSDDALYPTAVEASWQAAQSNPDAGVFMASWDETDAAGGVIGHVEAPAIARDAFHALFDPMLVGPPCRYLVRRAELVRAGLFDRSLRACEDWDMWLRLAAGGVRFVAVPQARVRYRNHPASMSKDPRLMWRSGLRVLDRAVDAHGSCARCREAKRRGKNTWREWCYVSILAPKLHSQPFPRAAAGALLALAHDPKLTRLLIGSLRRRSSGRPPTGEAHGQA
jgi:glycosyltransferase involved in cell wall biosynthesis